ncbi:hypothetical protein PROFUN_04538 [Planoprotostelium fungivorum]|uniref:Uncharacterized protein n=1 Tax=Planoprotostelium fungivorum TaxID=1890364 RepID=A0A2P6NBI8_9EUKA|nr:hypothetical protein PROFUN_04538 [Planoprotostelium fungivorum]
MDWKLQKELMVRDARASISASATATRRGELRHKQLALDTGNQRFRH